MEAETPPTNLEGLSEDDLPLDDDDARARLAKIRRLERWRALGPLLVIPGFSILLAATQLGGVAFLNVLSGKNPTHSFENFLFGTGLSCLIMACWWWFTLPGQIKVLQEGKKEKREESALIYSNAFNFLVAAMVLTFAAGRLPDLQWPACMLAITGSVFLAWACSKRSKERWQGPGLWYSRVFSIAFEIYLMAIAIFLVLMLGFTFTVYIN